jgi:hypothetical protein
MATMKLEQLKVREWATVEQAVGRREGQTVMPPYLRPDNEGFKGFSTQHIHK